VKETYILVLERGVDGVGCAYYCFADKRLPDESHLTLSRLHMFVKLRRQIGENIRIELSTEEVNNQ